MVPVCGGTWRGGRGRTRSGRGATERAAVAGGQGPAVMAVTGSTFLSSDGILERHF